jgi:hypothetical protein
MTRDELEHLLRASANVLNDRANLRRKHKFVVIGSQSILGQYPAAPVTILQSMEADIFPLDEPESADVIVVTTSHPKSATDKAPTFV